MTGAVVQVSVSKGGIPKRAIPSATLTETGSAGDAWRYPFHGGPRQAIQPCGTLDVYGRGIQAAMYDARVHDGDPESPRWGLSGFYASAIQPGVIRPGDAMVLLRSGHSRLTLS